MNKPLCAILLSFVGAAAFAYDSDPGYGQRGDVMSSSSVKSRSSKPTYFYKPTMRYYGKGYTVAYRFVQWNEKTSRNSPMTLEERKQTLPAATVESSDVRDPRVTLYHGTQSQTQPQVDTQTQQGVAKVPVKQAPPIVEGAPKK